MSSILAQAHQFFNGDSSHRYETVPDEERIYHSGDNSQYSETVRDMIFGLTDGLTVPFALAAGLSSLGNRHLIILGCLTALTASTISKIVGGWATSKAEEYQYLAERKREEFEFKHCLEAEIQEIIDVMQPYELDARSLAPLIEKLVNNPEKFIDFMMKFELNLEKPDPARSLQSALITGTSYFVSGLIPLIPYFFVRDCLLGLYLSIGITLTFLILFGYIKALYTCPSKAIWGAIQSIFVGFFSVTAAYGTALLIKHNNDLFEFNIAEF